MPKERKEDHPNDADPDSPFDRDHGASQRNISKPSEKAMKKAKAAKSSPSKSQQPHSASPSGSYDATHQKKGVCLDFSDPKVQTAMLLGLLAIMAVALWYGFTQGCFTSRRRRSCWLACDLQLLIISV